MIVLYPLGRILNFFNKEGSNNMVNALFYIISTGVPFTNMDQL